MMHERGKSDGPIVPAKFPNNGVRNRLDPSRPMLSPAEGMEGRGPALGNRRASRTHRTPCRMIRVPLVLAPIRRKGLQVFHVAPFFTSPLKAGAGCGNSARPDLCGGRAERPVPTATALRGARSASGQRRAAGDTRGSRHGRLPAVVSGPAALRGYYECG